MALSKRLKRVLCPFYGLHFAVVLCYPSIPYHDISLCNNIFYRSPSSCSYWQSTTQAAAYDCGDVNWRAIIIIIILLILFSFFISFCLSASRSSSELKWQSAKQIALLSYRPDVIVYLMGSNWKPESNSNKENIRQVLGQCYLELHYFTLCFGNLIQFIKYQRSISASLTQNDVNPKANASADALCTRFVNKSESLFTKILEIIHF